MVAAAQEVVGDESEEPLDLVDPGRVGRSEVHVEAGVLLEPGVDGRGLVGLIVVADQVDSQPFRDLGIDLRQEFLELDRPVFAVQAGDCLLYTSPSPRDS